MLACRAGHVYFTLQSDLCQRPALKQLKVRFCPPAWLLVLFAAASGAAPERAAAALDHELPLDQSGIWGRRYQTGLEYGVILTEVGGALWMGNDTDLGHTLWQTMDASLVSGIASLAMKRAFGRARPNQGNDPNAWFKGSCCESFPSGEVTLQASFVTPFIIDYAGQHPWIWALEVLPLYDSFARLKSQAHWQTDVMAGWALGTAAGYWSTTRRIPLTVQILPRGLSIGLAKRF